MGQAFKFCPIILFPVLLSTLPSLQLSVSHHFLLISGARSQSDHRHGTKLISHLSCEGHLKGIVNTGELVLLELLASEHE